MFESEILNEKYRTQTVLTQESGGSTAKYMEQAHQAVEELVETEGIQLIYASSKEFEQTTIPHNESSIGV